MVPCKNVYLRLLELRARRRRRPLARHMDFNMAPPLWGVWWRLIFCVERDFRVACFWRVRFLRWVEE
jgi:hypothetical protein